MKTIAIKQQNVIRFYNNGNQVFPVSVKGNIAEFENGELLLF